MLIGVILHLTDIKWFVLSSVVDFSYFNQFSIAYLSISNLIQALYFKEQDIDEFRDCFYLKTRPNVGQIVSVDELKTIMRSLGMSPTESELAHYFKEKSMI